MWGAFDRLKTSVAGATLVYVSITVAVVLGFIGLALDFSRHHITTTQGQAAADAAALAAASQLDGKAGSRARATSAAVTAASALVENGQRFTQERGQRIDVTVRFLASLPASDDDPITDTHLATGDEDAEFVEVTTEILNHSNYFLPVVGASASAELQSKAVAGQEAAVCRVTPFAICNPAENGADANIGAPFDVNNWVGRQIRVLSVGGQATDPWAPGNFGYLNIPGVGQGTPALADTIAGVDGANKCFSTELDTAPGAVNALRSALNTRFDIYENPFFGNDANNASYAPAPNVIKGRTWDAQGANPCHGVTDPPPAGIMELPNDNNIEASPGERFGNGAWNCGDYWTANHGTTAAPAGCTNGTTAISRWEIYNHEIDNVIPGPNPPPNGTNSVEEGRPVCYKGPPTPNMNRERRLITFAVMNCREHNVKGNSVGVPSEGFMRAFIIHPVGDPLTPGESDFQIDLEVVDVLQTGQANGILREYVEIFR